MKEQFFSEKILPNFFLTFLFWKKERPFLNFVFKYKKFLSEFRRNLSFRQDLAKSKRLEDGRKSLKQIEKFFPKSEKF